MASKYARLSARDEAVYCRPPCSPSHTPRTPMHRSLAFVLVLLVAPSLSAADWPQWRGPNRDGVSTETGLLKTWPKDGPKLAWKANLGGVGYGSPVIVGDKLIITAAED